MSKIVQMDGSYAPHNREPQGGIVGTLELLLEAAKSGEIQGICCATLIFDGGTEFHIAGQQTRAMRGALGDMMFEMQKIEDEK